MTTGDADRRGRRRWFGILGTTSEPKADAEPEVPQDEDAAEPTRSPEQPEQIDTTAEATEAEQQ